MRSLMPIQRYPWNRGLVLVLSLLAGVFVVSPGRAAAQTPESPDRPIRPPGPPAGEIEEPVVRTGYIPELFGDREVKYNLTGDIATIEGDIIVHPTDTPPAPTIVAFRRNLWPGGIIPYTIEPGFLNTASVMQAMADWERLTPIRFVPRRFQPGYVVFRNHPTANAGSAELAFSGRAQDVRIGMNLSKGATSHEIGHAAGLDHEHNSPRRDRFVQILMGNVQDGQKHNFDIASYSAFALLRPYDFSSIMHYAATTFGKVIPPGPARMVTMMRRDGAPGPLGFGSDLTADDIAGVEALYGPFTFMSHASGGYPIGGKTCYTVGPEPYRFGAFQAKTGGAVFCVDKPTWFWSNIGDKDPKIAPLPPDSYRCLEIREPADADFSIQPNYICYPFKTPMILTWSDSGPRPGMKCVLFYAPEAGAAWNDNHLCYFNATLGVLGEAIRDSTGRCIHPDVSNRAVTASCGTHRWRMTTLVPGTTTTLVYEPVDYFGNYTPRCLGVAGSSVNPGDRVVLETCTGKPSQTWAIGGGQTLRTGGLCMRVDAGGAVTLGACDGTPATQWLIRRDATTPL